jgi:[ribosomal protein S5]-alanine N-acetyltransferase
MGEHFEILTPRLLIREIKITDGQAILSAVACPEIDSMHNHEFKTIPDIQRYISVLDQEYKNKKYRTLAIAQKTTNQLVGSITIDIHKYFPRAELSYWIGMPYRNQGYATEAVKAVVDYGILTLNLGRIQATHHINNPASGRVLEKAGMVYEGTLRRYYELNGVSLDEKMYSTIRSDIVQE